MLKPISFTASEASPAATPARHRAATVAMRRHVPYVVTWGCARPGAAISLVLPEGLTAGDLVRHAAREGVQLAADGQVTAAHTIELHYAHLDEAEIEEGIRRLGCCLARCLTLAARIATPECGTVAP